MQEVEFLPRPNISQDREAGEAGQDAGTERRPAFNLAPPLRPVRLSMPAPLACRATRAWLMLAAASGRPLRIEPGLMNDPIVDCVKALNQLGAALTREEDGVTAREAAPLRAGQVLRGRRQRLEFFPAVGLLSGPPLAGRSREPQTGGLFCRAAFSAADGRASRACGATTKVARHAARRAQAFCPDAVTLPADVPAGCGEHPAGAAAHEPRATRPVRRPSPASQFWPARAAHLHSGGFQPDGKPRARGARPAAPAGGPPPWSRNASFLLAPRPTCFPAKPPRRRLAAMAGRAVGSSSSGRWAWICALIHALIRTPLSPAGTGRAAWCAPKPTQR